VPEVVYAWRMHAGSTSGNIGSKDYIYASQRALLARLVAAGPHPERFAIEPSPLFPGTPNWRIRRLPVAARPIVTVVIGDPDSAAVAAWRAASTYPAQRWTTIAEETPPRLDALVALARAAQAEGALVRLLADTVAPVPPCDDDAMLWEAVGLFERFADTAMVGGRIVVADGRIVAAGGYFAYRMGADCPDVGRPLDDPGYQGQMWQQRTVDAVDAALAVVEPGFLIEAIEAARNVIGSMAFLGAWCGAVARRTGRRVIYTPFITGRAVGELGSVTRAERLAFFERHEALAHDTALFSPRLDRGGPGYRAALDTGGV
jgi:hypothetical protein